MADIHVNVQGLERLIAKASGNAILAGPMRTFMQQATQTVHLEAFKRTPRVTGQLQASLATQVDPRPLPLWGRVGTSLVYGPWIEMGVRSDPRVKGVVRRKAGPARMLRGGFEAALPRVKELLHAAGLEMERLWRA